MVLGRQIRADLLASVDRASKVSQADPSQREQLAESALKILEDAYELIKKCQVQINIPNAGNEACSPELLVLAAEAAIVNRSWVIAEEATDAFFRLNGPKDQFYCRALFAKALVEAEKAVVLNGAEAVAQVRFAASFILQALEVALAPRNNPNASDTEKRQYDFLVYNASVHYWTVARPLLRKGTARYMAEGFAQIVKALEEAAAAAASSTNVGSDGGGVPTPPEKETGIGDPAWMMQLLVALAQTHDDASDCGKASVCLNSALEQAGTAHAASQAKVDAAAAMAKEASEAVDAVHARFRRLAEGAQDPGGSARSGRSTGRSHSKTASPRTDAETPRTIDGTPREPEDPDTIEKCEADLVTAEEEKAEKDELLEEVLASHSSVQAEYEEVFRQAVHLGRHFEKDAESKKILDQMRTIANNGDERLKYVLRLQILSSGIVNGDAAKKELLALLKEIDPVAVESKDDSDENETEKGKEAPPNPAYLDLILTLGKLLVDQQMDANARKVIERIDLGKDLSPTLRVRLDYLKAQLLATELDREVAVPASQINIKTKEKKQKFVDPDDPDANKPDPKLDQRRMEALRLSRRVEALKLLDRALLACKRVGDPDLLQEGCVLAWNIGLNLLQPHLRKHVHRVFQLAAHILEELQSPLMELRAQLHLEVAKCELASDFLAKAQEEAGKALATDYGKVDSERLANAEAISDEDPREPKEVLDAAEAAAKEAKDDQLRPLDRHIRPLLRRLELKSKVYEEPDSPEEKALLLLDQAREVTNLDMQKNLLTKASKLLEQAAMQSQDTSSRRPSGGSLMSQESTLDVEAAVELVKVYGSANADGTGFPMEKPSPALKRRVPLWNEIVEMGWAIRNFSLVHRGAVAVLADMWDREKNREFIALQVQVQYTLGECFIEELKQMVVIEEEDEEWNEDASRDEEGTDPRILGLDVASTPERMQELKALAIGAFVGGCRRALHLGELYLVENGAIYLWNYHLHVFQQQMYLEEEVMNELVEGLQEIKRCLIEAGTKNIPLLVSISEALACIHEARGNGEEAEATCSEIIPLGRPMQVKKLVEIRARVQCSQDPKSVTLQDPKPFSVLSHLVVMGHDSTEEAEKISALDAALNLMKSWKDELDIEEQQGVKTSLEEDEEKVELQVELWTRLAKEALQAGRARQAQSCCQSGLALLPDSSQERQLVPKKVWRWLSVCECLWGQAVAKMVAPDAQDKILQDNLRIGSLQHLVLAARYGNYARLTRLVVDAVKNLWGVALPMMGSSVARAKIFEYTREALDEMSKCSGKADLVLRVHLSVLVFECYADQQDWEGGLQAVTEAFNHIPPVLQRPLWQWRVVFMSKLGKSVLDGMQKMKESNPILQAKVWATLAHSASSRQQQLMAYLHSIDILKERFDQVEYLIELGEWMIIQDLEKRDAKDWLLVALNIFLDVEENEGDNEDEEEMSAHGSVILSQGSRRNSRKTSRTGSRRLSRTGSRTGAPSPSGTRKRPKSASRKAKSKAGSARRSSVSSIVSGSSMGGTTMSGEAPRALDVVHLEALMRLLNMMASLAEDFSERADRLMQAHHFLNKLMGLCVDSANIANRIAAWEALTDEEKEGKVQITFVAEYPARYTAPVSPLDWATWNPDADFYKYLRDPPEGKERMVLNSETLIKPPLTLHHMLGLADAMCEAGLHAQALAPLAIIHAMAEVIPHTQVMEVVKSLAGLRRGRLLLALGQSELALEVLNKAGKLGLTRNDAKAFMQEVEQIEQQNQAKKLGRGSVQFALTGNKLEVEQQPSIEEWKVSRVEVRTVWNELAREAIAFGQHRAAMEYLEQTSRHNSAFQDERGAARTLELQAKIALLQGRLQQAGSGALQVQSKFHKRGADPRAWSRTSMLLGRSLFEQNNMGDLKKVMLKTIEALKVKIQATGKPNQEPEGDVDLDAAVATLECSVLYGQFITTDVLQNIRLGALWEEDWIKMIQLLDDIFDHVAPLGQHHIAIIDAMIEFAHMGWKVAVACSIEAGVPANIDDLNSALKHLEMACTTLQDMIFFSDTENHEIAFLPIARKLATALIEKGRLHLYLARLHAEFYSEVKRKEEYNRTVLNPVDRWMDGTKPKSEPTPEEMAVPHTQKALAAFAQARRLLGITPKLTSLADVGTGISLAFLAMKEGSMDLIWDEGAHGDFVVMDDDGNSVDDSIVERGSLKSQKTASSKKDLLKKETARESSPERTRMSVAGPSFEPTVVLDEAGDRYNQAVISLETGIQSAIKAKQWEAAGEGAQALVECLGRRDLNQSIEALLLFQSCAVRKTLLEKMQLASKENDYFKLFLDQYNDQHNEIMFPNKKAYSPNIQAEAFLKENYIAWQRLECSAPVSDIIKSLPEKIWLMPMQFNADRDTLYIALVGKSFNGTNGQVDGTKELFKIEFNLKERMKLIELQQKSAKLQLALNKFFLAFADEHGEFGDLGEKLQVDEADDLTSVGTTRSSSRAGANRPSDDEEVLQLPSDVDNEFQELLTDLQQLLTDSFPKRMVDLLGTLCEAGAGLVLLPDACLTGFPLEGLSLFQDFVSISRDFSAHIFHHRLLSISDNGQSALKIDVMNNQMSYIVDPLKEDNGSVVPNKPRPSILETFDPIKTKGKGSSWTGVTGESHTPGPREWQSFLKNKQSGGFLYYGPGRVLAHFSPSDLCGLNTPGCQIVIIADRADNDFSYHRQSKVDNKKKPFDLLGEGPFETATLFSLSGANAVLLNIYPVSFHHNRRMVTNMLTSLWGKTNIGEALVKCRRVSLPSKDKKPRRYQLRPRSCYSTVLYGLPFFELK